MIHMLDIWDCCLLHCQLQLPLQNTNVMISFLLAIYKTPTAVRVFLRDNQKTNHSAVFNSNVFNSKY